MARDSHQPRAIAHSQRRALSRDARLALLLPDTGEASSNFTDLCIVISGADLWVELMSPQKPSSGRCGKKTRGGGRCKRWPIKGGKVCATHGGSARQVKRKAKQRLEAEKAQKAVAFYGLAREIEPHEALIEEIHRTAGHVSWLGSVVEQMRVAPVPGQVEANGKDAEGEQAGTTVVASVAAETWLNLYRDERDRLVRVSKAAIDAGVAERQVRIVEAQAQRLAQVVTAIIRDLGHDLRDAKVREIVRHRMLESG